MDPNLIIDDEYVYGVGDDCVLRGERLENVVETYISILNEIKEEALIEGSVSEALQAFIECMNSLNNQLTIISKRVDDTGMSFIQDINTADDFLF